MTSIRDALDRLWTAADDARMVQQNGRWATWGSVRQLSEQIDRELAVAGCYAGGRVAVVLNSRAESVAALIAVLRTNRTLVTLSPLQPPARLADDFAASGACFVLAPESLWTEPVFARAVTEAGAAGWSLGPTGLMLRTHRMRMPSEGDPDVAIEMLTSGTTGPPKRIPLARRQLEASLASALHHHNRPEVRDKPLLTGSVGMVTIPIVHIGGLWALLQALVAARPFVMLERFSVPAWRSLVQEHRPIVAGLPPPAIRSVLDSAIPREDLSSIRAITAGTAPVNPMLVDEFLERYGIPILIVYGATEFSGAVAGWTIEDFRTSWTTKKGSVGRAFPGVKLRIVDDAGAELSSGETGRLQVASLQTGSTDGWTTTSDLAHLDDDGYLYIDGRADDVIVRGGFKVAPETVVRSLRTHPAVADAAVAGLPESRLGQVPVAAVEVRSGGSVTEAQLRAHCRTMLAPYEVPTQIFVVGELPRGAALKVDRRRLATMLEELRGNLRPASAGR